MNDPNQRFGWSEIDVELSSTLSPDTSLDFEVTEEGGDGVAPGIASVQVVGPSSLHISLTETIEPGAITCFYHINSGTKFCLGFLPGDVNRDRVSSPVDILRLIDALNGITEPPYAEWQTDLDRSGATTPADVLRLIDLLNGADAFEVWNGHSLPECP